MSDYTPFKMKGSAFYGKAPLKNIIGASYRSRKGLHKRPSWMDREESLEKAYTGGNIGIMGGSMAGGIGGGGTSTNIGSLSGIIKQNI